MTKDKNREVRQGVTGSEVTSSGGTFVIIELILVALVGSFLLYGFFRWNFFLSLICLFIGLVLMITSGIYRYFGFVFSLGWGTGTYFAGKMLIESTGGNLWASQIGGIIVGLFIFAVTMGGRNLGTQYFKDIENNANE